MARHDAYGNGLVSVPDLRTRKGTGSSKLNRLGSSSPVLCIIAVLLFLSINSWAKCTYNDGYAYSDFRCHSGQLSKPQCAGQFNCEGNRCWQAYAGQTGKYVGVRGFYCGCGSGAWACCSYYYCNTDCEADSARTEGAIYECQYDVVEQKYYRWQCTGNFECSSGTCQKIYYNDSTLCHTAKCRDFPQDPSCAKDTTWTCTSVSTENGVIRASIQKYLDGVASGTSTEVLGSCIENGYCEGEYNSSMLAMDSCSYDSISADKCKYGGQDGSACYYVCPDGQNHMCRMAIASGGTLPSCPSKPWKSCADSIDRKPNPNDSYNPGDYNPPSDSLSDPSGEMPEGSDETDVLLAIRDTLHHANEQRKFQMYVEENIYNTLAGYGIDNGDGIIQNVRNINANTRATQNAVQNVVRSTNNIVSGLDNLVTIIENDTLKAEIVGMPDSIYTYNASVPLVFRIDSTLEQTNNLMQEIRDLTDTLVSDTPRTNIIMGRIAPTLDSALSFIVDNSPVGMIQRQAQAFADSISAKIQPFYDFVTIDTSYVDSIENAVDYIQDIWGNEVIVPIDSSPGLVHFEPSLASAIAEVLEGPFADFNRWNDSVVAFSDSVLQDRIEKMQDTTKDTLPLDKVAGDSANIRNKLQKVFLPDEILYECFDFHLNHTFRFTIFNKSFSWDFKILIDFADLFGLDLCDLIRKIVQILTFILIVFTTIKGYIRAFGGGDTL